MLETVAKNLWLLLTLVIPGLFTYGVWRALLILEPSTRLEVEVIAQLDKSAIVTASVILAVALLQQAIAVAIEGILALLAKSRQGEWPNFYSLICGRFELMAAGKLDENATRIVGNFFLSINMCIGLLLLLLYFMAYEAMDKSQWIPIGLTLLAGATLFSATFRMFNAMWAIRACERQIVVATFDQD